MKTRAEIRGQDRNDRPADDGPINSRNSDHVHDGGTGEAGETGVRQQQPARAVQVAGL